MLQEFITQNYLIIEQNIVTNVVVWDGDTTQWTPPQGSIALVQATTLAKVWTYDKASNTYVLTEELGAGSIGFTWDGSLLTTNEPQPAPPKSQPVSSGTTTA